MNHEIKHPADCDRIVKLDGEKLRCYSKKRLNALHPSGDYTLVSETSRLWQSEGRPRGRVSRVAYSDSILLETRPYRQHRRPFYREVGYLPVGDGCYIAVLGFSPVAFLLMCLGIAAALILAVFLLKNALGPGPDEDPLDPIPQKPPQVQESLGEMPTEEPVQDGNSVSLTYVLEAKVSLSTGAVGVYFANPAKSNQDIVIELHLLGGDEDAVLATSGLIPRGNSVSLLNCSDSSLLSRLSPGDYAGYYRVVCYDYQTGERALVEPKISDVVITVIG